MADYLIRFVSTLDPNGDTGIAWPQYELVWRQMLTLPDTNGSLSLTPDTFRPRGIDYCTTLSATYLL